MEKSIEIKSFLYENDSYEVYFDSLREKIWIERKTLELLSNKSRVILSKAISRLLMEEKIIQIRNIKHISNPKNKKIFLYDLAVLKEIVSSNLYEKLFDYEKELINEYNKNHKKIFMKNGSIYINRYLINNILDLRLDILDIKEICEVNSSDILRILNKPIYDIYDFINIVFNINNEKTKEIRNNISNIFIKCLVDGYYINNEICSNNNKIIEITKIIDSLLDKNKLDDEEKKKYYNNTITYNNELYESSSFIDNLIKSAKEEIIIISKFMDDDIFFMIKKAPVKVILYSSKNSLITKYNTLLYSKNHIIETHKNYLFNDTYIIIDNDIYFFTISIIDILKSNSICIKKNIEIDDLFKNLKL